MNLLSPEQLASTQKASLDTMFVLACKTFDGWQKLVELNLRTTRSTLTDAQEHALKALPSSDPQTALALQMSLVGPIAEKVQTYNRDLYGIIASTLVDFAAAVGTQYETHNLNVQTIAEGFLESAPAGSEAVVAAVESTISATNTLYDTMHNTVQQAIEVAGSSIEATLNGTSVTGRQAGGQTPRTAKP
ncbi:phasin family protein [Paraburkholderia sp. GAS448]|uniref:phasin family protein n=1 Tax=Paraburkholderia sp. GAS448 TaxID=3035136 RepID=UPI003D1D5E1D